jgi:hypothetical protein
MKLSSPTARPLRGPRSTHTWLATLTTAFIACAGGCSSPEVVPATGPRSPLRPDQVSIYQEEPSRYELHGAVTVTHSEGAKWDERGNADVAFDNLKAKAAALGANGLLLSAEPGTFDRLATAGYHGTFYQIPIRGNPPEAFAKAIYVSKK